MMQSKCVSRKDGVEGEQHFALRGVRVKNCTG